jgi:hypothetical protein
MGSRGCAKCGACHGPLFIGRGRRANLLVNVVLNQWLRRVIFLIALRQTCSGLLSREKGTGKCMLDYVEQVL